jgi:hypothetical protein
MEWVIHLLRQHSELAIFRRRLLDWKNENKTIQFGNRHQCIASRGISGTA